jgi:hypothetical protein
MWDGEVQSKVINNLFFQNAFYLLTFFGDGCFLTVQFSTPRKRPATRVTPVLFTGGWFRQRWIGRAGPLLHRLYFHRASPPAVELVSRQTILTVHVRLNAKDAALVEASMLLLGSVRAKSS